MLPLDPAAPAVTGGVSRIAPEVWRIVATNPSPLTGPGTNTYVVGRERPIVIDPGTEDRQHLQRVLEVAGGRVDSILCTHSHPDHSPGASQLHARTRAPVCGLPPPRDRHQDPTYRPDTVVTEGQHFAVGENRLRAILTPGHASNHVCYLLEDDGLLFTGDHLMHGSTVVIIPPDGSMKGYLDSLRRLQTMSIRALAPGHGSVIDDAQGEIVRVIAHRLARETKVATVLSRHGTATLDAMLPEVYDDVPVSMHEWARYSLFAHAIKLVEDGRADVKGSVYRWRG